MGLEILCRYGLRSVINWNKYLDISMDEAVESLMFISTVSTSSKLYLHWIFSWPCIFHMLVSKIELRESLDTWDLGWNFVEGQSRKRR